VSEGLINRMEGQADGISELMIRLSEIFDEEFEHEYDAFDKERSDEFFAQWNKTERGRAYVRRAVLVLFLSLGSMGVYYGLSSSEPEHQEEGDGSNDDRPKSN